MLRKIVVKMKPGDPFAMAIKNVGGIVDDKGEIVAKDVEQAIVHLRGKTVRVHDRRREAWTFADALAVETLIQFSLAMAKDVAEGSGQGGGI